MNKTLGNIFKGDKVIWMVFFFLCIISVVEVFSASSSLTYKGGNYWSPVLKHAGILLLGLFVMIVTLNIKCKYFKVTTPFLILLSYILLVSTLIGGVALNDGHRWVSLLGMQFQPSEIAKGTMVLATAQILSATQTDSGADRRAFWWVLLVCLPMIMLIAPENLSTAMLIAATIFMMLVIGRVPKLQLFSIFAVAAGLVVAAMIFIFVFSKMDKTQDVPQSNETEMVAKAPGAPQSDGTEVAAKAPGNKIFHRATLWRSRIESFFDHEKKPADEVDIEGKDAQRSFSNIAIASAHITGVGPGNSEERDFLSQAFSDFIYAIIIEELGLAGAFLVAFLYIILLYRTGRIAARCENNFPAFLAMGLALMLTTQALFNMCVAVGLLPITGQPLPLISKGGTSTVINCIYIGTILSISRTAKRRGAPDIRSRSSIPDE
ncbi:MAG: FtsW/RodA/SpoVE family cell cycle protein [Prevotella sp.]|nr:FtsW/RodA/SpoVE family cell cycle protein [Prevotella sp.]